MIGERLRGLRYRLVLLVGMAVLGIAGTAAAQEAVDELALRVGTTVAPPFAMRDDGGEWYGIAIDLWRALADEMRLEFELVELSLIHISEPTRLDARSRMPSSA